MKFQPRGSKIGLRELQRGGLSHGLQLLTEGGEGVCAESNKRRKRKRVGSPTRWQGSRSLCSRSKVCRPSEGRQSVVIYGLEWQAHLIFSRRSQREVGDETVERWLAKRTWPRVWPRVGRIRKKK